MDELRPLLGKLQKSKFTGSLTLRFEGGQVASAELQHYLSKAEFTKPLPTIDEEKGFALKP